jgi:hypothetical protein
MNVLCRGFKKTYSYVTVLDIKKLSFCKLLTYFVIINLGLDPDWSLKISKRLDPDPYSAKYLDPD